LIKKGKALFKRPSPDCITIHKMVLKSLGPCWLCGFDSRPRHFEIDLIFLVIFFPG
jgi:hypothetical protein